MSELSLPAPRPEPESGEWTAAASSRLYGMEQWASGYFSVSPEGTVHVHPDGRGGAGLDLEGLVRSLEDQGLALPILLRFGGILAHRIGCIQSAFAEAIRQHDYDGRFQAIYPIKVNQQRHVVEDIWRHGREWGLGLEAGSKPELLAVLALADDRTPILCNGFKDQEYVETAVLAGKLGREICLVVERRSEIDELLALSEQYDARPRIGVRMRMASRGAGRWRESTGLRSKFGLQTSELLEVVDTLRAAGRLDDLALLHFHLGSQITDIRQIKAAVTEAARVYAQLVDMGAGLRVLDVGGGLGVDYDGSAGASESSINYSLQEYANDIVYHVQSVCQEAGVATPTLYAECGRAITAYHSVLVFDVLGVSGPRPVVDRCPPEGSPAPLRELYWAHDSLDDTNWRECLHDAQQALEQLHALFSLGHLSLAERAAAENVYLSLCHELRAKVPESLTDDVPELEAIESVLADTYYCNFSVFQSLPDSWAIGQLFPIVPVHRLLERPTRRGVLADLTCDSDGRIRRFTLGDGEASSLPLHDPGDEPYWLAAFLGGAYQEILGDLHNLFGDTNAVHVGLGAAGETVIEEVVEGDTVREVLSYVQFDVDSLLAKFRRDVAAAVSAGRLERAESKRLLRFYESELLGYTYLEAPG